MELTEGCAVGPYRLVGRAGSGGMAEVWRAYDARPKRYVAIKFLSPRYASEPPYLERFRHEAQAISDLDHPHILTIHDYGEQDGWTHMVSPYVGGGTLAAQLRRGPGPSMRLSPCSSRWPQRSTTRMRKASSTAMSSRRMSSSPSVAVWS